MADKQALVYQPDVYDSVCKDGVSVSIRCGELVEMQGSQWVKSLSAGFAERMDDRWHPTRQAAKRAAADRVQAMSDLLARQALQLRQEADREQAAEAHANG